MKWIGVLALSLLLPLSVSAKDDESGTLYTWVHLKQGKTLATESLRLVDAESGTSYASGRLNVKGAGKASTKETKKSHIQLQDGKLIRYQRLNGGAAAPGVRFFEWQGKMRLVWVKTPSQGSQPKDFEALETARVWDEGLIHLMALWELPKRCETRVLPYFDLASAAVKEATFDCEGLEHAKDAQGTELSLHAFHVKGIKGAPEKLYLDLSGGLIAAKTGDKLVLRSGYSLEEERESAPQEEPEDDETQKEIRDRGVGE